MSPSAEPEPALESRSLSGPPEEGLRCEEERWRRSVTTSKSAAVLMGESPAMDWVAGVLRGAFG